MLRRYCSIRRRALLWNGLVGLSFIAGCAAVGFAQETAAAPQALSAERRKMLDDGLAALQKKVEALPKDVGSGAADAAIFAKGLRWALLYDREFAPADVALMEKALLRGNQRVAAIASNRAIWLGRRGKVALGYISAVDGSVQPYGLIVPKGYDSSKPMRLDVVLHGSTRPVGLSELTDADLDKIIGTYHAWRGDNGAGSYADIAGFCRSAKSEEIAGHNHVLTPGRYVGAEEIEDDGEPFEEKMSRLVAELNDQFAESAKLEDAIKSNLKGLGYGE